MDDIIESLSKLIPFEKWGMKRESAEPLSIIILTLISILALYLWKRNEKIKKSTDDLHPQFDKKSIKNARKFFIQTQYQNASPSRQDEPGFTHQFIARNKLIPFFTKTAFLQKTTADRFYLILADSGMGKTTFMVNLFFKYNTLFNTRKKYDIKLFRFSNEDTIKNIKSVDVKAAKKTILLLDALDEDRGIVSTSTEISDAEAFKKRVDEIIEITRNFFVVILTCRTQYFPNQEADPYELKIRRPDEKGFYTLSKIYISPFTDREVNKYLNKKLGAFSFLSPRKKKTAIKIIKHSEKLVVRPMLLSYIEFLIENPLVYHTSYSIYNQLVLQWLKREAEKRKIIVEQEAFIRTMSTYLSN